MSIQRHTEARRTVDQVRHTLEGLQSTVRAELPAGTNRSINLASSLSPEYEILKIKRAVGDIAGIENPFYCLHDGRACDTTSIGGRKIVNFSSYDYLGLNGHARVAGAAKTAIDQFGTASRLSAGERQVHRDLESALAALHGVESAVAFVGGHATNVSILGTLLNKEDLIVADTAIHNSIVEGARLSGTRLILCPHGDITAFE